METTGLTVISVSFRSHVLCYVVQSRLQISAGELLCETARWQKACCRQTRDNTAAVSLSDGWAWYGCNPVKAFWRITMSNSKPCNMHYNNKGILQTFFNLGALNRRLTRLAFTSTRSSIITFSPSTHHLSAVLSPPSVHHCPRYTISCLCTHPSAFHSLSLHFIAAQSLFLSGFNLLVDTTLLSVRLLQGSHSSLSYLTPWRCNYRKQAFPATQLASWVISQLFLFVAADLHDLHVLKKKKTSSGFYRSL